MRRIAVTALLAFDTFASASAGEVYVTKDAQGRPIYTDRPDSLPAERVGVASRQTDPADVKKRYDEEMKQYSQTDKTSEEAARHASAAKQAKTDTAADKAKRCQEARTQYTALMNAHRVYDEGEQSGERHYLDSNEIDAARANAKAIMDEFCSGQ
jgi:hypothetical protein